MPSVSRSLNVDRIITGHGCSATAPIAGSLQSFATIGIQNVPIAVVGDPIGPHLIRAGKFCIPHPAIINTFPGNGSQFVSVGITPVARIGDSADAGRVISGSRFVWAN